MLKLHIMSTIITHKYPSNGSGDIDCDAIGRCLGAQVEGITSSYGYKVGVAIGESKTIPGGSCKK